MEAGRCSRLSGPIPLTRHGARFRSSRSTRRLLAGAWLGTLGACGGLPQDTECPDTVGCADTREALASDPQVPLKLGETSVMLVIACTLRKDRVQPWGAPRPTAPFLDAMARQGVLFEHTYVQAPWTRPSVGSLVTGQWPASLNLDDPDADMVSNRALSEDVVTLADLFQDAGYRTVGASANPNVNSLFGFSQGFDVNREPEVLWRDARAADLPKGDTVVDEVLSALEPGVPHYVQAVFVDTHTPRRPSRVATRALFARTQRPTDDLGMRLAEYDAAVRTLDGHLARLFVEARRRLPNLLFVLVGDHGEGLSFPEGHGMAHGNFLYSSATEVPFLVHHPSLPEPGRRIRGVACGIDLVPTLLDLLGIPHPPGLAGRSEMDPILGRSQVAVHSESYAQTWFRRSDRASVIMSLGGRTWHLIRNGQGGPVRKEWELYDLGEGLEERETSFTQPGVTDELMTRLTAWEARMREAAAAGGPPRLADLPETTTRRLKAMGYVE